MPLTKHNSPSPPSKNLRWRVLKSQWFGKGSDLNTSMYLSQV